VEITTEKFWIGDGEFESVSWELDGEGIPF
jgi:hypothetical protein